MLINIRYFTCYCIFAISLPLVFACAGPGNDVLSSENDEDVITEEPEPKEVIAEEPEPEDPVSPSLVVELSLDDLVNLADYIAAGAITSIESKWNEDNTQIYTFNKFEVSKYLKGCDDDELIIKVPGGRVGSEEQWVEDTPIFKEGEEVVLFLERKDDGTFDVVGGFQGVYRARTEGLIENGLSLPEVIERIKSKINGK